MDYSQLGENARRRSGFSMIEILIVVAFTLVLAGTLAFNLVGYRNRTNLDSAAKQISALLRTAQSRSAAQESSAAWGVYLENSAAAPPFYALFRGTYSSSTTEGRYTLPAAVNYSTSSIAEGSSLEVTFAPISGAPSAAVSITLNLSAGGSIIATSTITVSSSGLVSF